MKIDGIVRGGMIVTGAQSAARFISLSKHAVSEASAKIDWIEGLSRQGLVDNAAMIQELVQRLSFTCVMGPPSGMPHEPQVIAYSEWLRSPAHSRFSIELSALSQSVPPDLRERLRITMERLDRALLPEGWQGTVSEARKQYDGEPGLARLESALELSGSGDESERLSAIVLAVGELVPTWEAMTPTALLSQHDAIQALFTVTDHVALASFVNRTPGSSAWNLPNCWWARLAIALDKANMYDPMVKQIHRETHAMAAQKTIREERSMGGRAKAAKAQANPEKVQAVEYARSHAGVSAVQIKMRLGLRASERTIRGWLSATC